MEKEYSDFVAELAERDAHLAGTVAGWHGLESVLTWMKAKDLPPGSVDLIGQDEFEYDFVVELERRVRWLVFGVT
jgi:hypothetical protein